jgi:hypothetical protein
MPFREASINHVSVSIYAPKPLGSKNYELLKNKKGIRQVFHYYNRTAPGMD